MSLNPFSKKYQALKAELKEPDYQKELAVKAGICVAFAGGTAYLLGGIFADIVAAFPEDFLAWLPGSHDLRGQIALFVICLAWGWFSLFTTFKNWMEDIIGPKLAARLHLTPMATENADIILDVVFNGEPWNLVHAGTIDRTIKYSNRDNVTRTARIQTRFKIARSTAVMSPREDAAARILLLLRLKSLLSFNNFQRLKYAIVWGDGAASVEMRKFNINRHAAREINVRGPDDVVRYDASLSGAMTQPAISELFSRLVAAAAEKDCPPEVKRLKDELFAKPGSNGDGNRKGDWR